MTVREIHADRLPAADAETMAEVRAGVDSIDRELVGLIAERMGYMDAAARIKPVRAAVRDEVRKAQVIANVRREAAAHGVAPELVAELWETLIEASIAHELVRWDLLRTREPLPVSGNGASDGT